MAVLSEDEIGKRCVAAAVALSFAHLLTIAGTLYQDPPTIGTLRLDVEVVNFGIFLSPVFVLLIVRRVCIIVGIFAIPVLIFFTLRMHNVWQFYWFGINSMATQKGDALNFLTIAFEMLSAVIAAAMLLGIFLWKLTWRK